MQRREVVRYLSAALALPFLPRNAEAAIELGARLHRRLVADETVFRTLDHAQQVIVTDLAEMIIPETDTPGANSVQVPQFIDLIATEWMDDGERAAFLTGIDAIAAQGFASMTRAQQTALVSALDASTDRRAGAAFGFARVKALTVYGYFTSERVQQDVLKTQMFFDGYRGDVPFTPAV